MSARGGEAGDLAHQETSFRVSAIYAFGSQILTSWHRFLHKSGVEPASVLSLSGGSRGFEMGGKFRSKTEVKISILNRFLYV